MTLEQLYDLLKRHKHDGETQKMNDGVLNVLMSFESGEQTQTKLYFPYAIRVLKIRGIVMKAIAGTDNGTITGANEVGSSNTGVITCIASDVINTEYVVSPVTNITVGKGSYYKLSSSKTTAGGRVLVSLEYQRI